MRRGFNGRTGLLAQGGGLPRSAGSIFAPPVLDGEAIAFGKLGETLRISRASVSASRQLLEERALVRRVTRPGVRQDYLQDAPEAYAAMLASALRRVDAVRAEIDARIAALWRGGDAKITSRSDGGREDDGSAAWPRRMLELPRSDRAWARGVLGRIRNEKADAQ
jgi:hypothetical protein